ncbi:uncharacterized protein LOC115691551 [Syzygium oleosum]|uniref:uncharacterized protein LOC115691551 n=1 Tax=Syzygium oleosum TaxID=219896 RepID=UPI0024BA0778|nr:uncharacterized protein LOC115691551 [Syzygium oleosum]
MILPVIAALSSGVIMKKMKVMQVFSSRFKELWEEWELRGVIFLSLTLQILLICMGSRRKYIHFAWFRGVVWLAYLMADAVAIYALGIITNKVTKLKSQSVDTKTQLNAFWAPFLLLHLGGPDTITAYALEDNELWLRHLLSLVTQTGVTFYIFLMAWTGMSMSILAIVIIFAGLVKYGERVYVLWTASSEQFRDSIPDPPPNYSKILEQHKLMEAEGYDVIAHEVIEVRDVTVEYNVDGADLSCSEESLHDLGKLYKRKQGELLAARGLANIFQRLFADLLLSLEDRDTSWLVLKDKNFLAAFKIIEIELGIVYNLLYTKAKAIHTSWGFARRITGLVSICIVLVLFILIEDQHYSVADLYLTYILLAAAIFLEIYALVVLLFSDKTACWLIKEKKFAVLDFINWLQPLTKRRRWSDHMAQYSLLSFAIKEKHLPCHQILEFLQIDEKVEKPLYKHHKKVTNDLKKLIMSHITGMQSPQTTRGSQVLENNQMESLKWSIELEFDQSILIWHIATELLCHPNSKNPGNNEPQVNENKSISKISKRLSRYMLYILVMYPMMLPTGIGRIKFQETYVEAMKFFNEFRKLNKPKPIASEDTDQKAGFCASPGQHIKNLMKPKPKPIASEDTDHKAGFCASPWQHIKNFFYRMSSKRQHIKNLMKRKFDLTIAYNELRDQVKTNLNLTVSKGDRSKYVLFHGCQLASQLDKIEKQEDKWKLISEVWVEMLCYAASNCKGSYHAQQLRRGGELLTHVWLMMAHFGLTNHFQIPHTPAIAELIMQ